MKKEVGRLLFLGFFCCILFFTYSCTKDESNQPPLSPVLFSPANNDTGVSRAPTLIWSACYDPENSITYDLYFGMTNPPGLFDSNITLNKYVPYTLAICQKYYWKIVAKDNLGNSSSSMICNFTTGFLTQNNGDIHVLVCDQTQTNYFGGAEVFLYKTDADRNNDPARKNYYRKAITDNYDPQGLGAVFYELSDQQYFLFGRVYLGGGNFLNGVTQGYARNSNIVTFILVVH
jgi:hypothetical protein